MFGFLRRLGAAILNKGPRALLAEIPLVNVLVEVADDLYKRMREEKQTEVQVQIVNVAAASPEQTNKEVAKVIEELAKDQKIEIKNAVSTILKQVPASMRRSLPRGRSDWKISTRFIRHQIRKRSHSLAADALAEVQAG